MSPQQVMTMVVELYHLDIKSSYVYSTVLKAARPQYRLDLKSLNKLAPLPATAVDPDK